jgi:HK97 family phage portal protein
VKSPLGTLLRLRNQTKPPIPLDNGRAFGRGLAFNLGNGRQDAETFMRQYGISGTVFGIVSLLAESTATPPWHLYKKQPVDGRRRYTTGDQGSDQRIEVVQHAAIQLVNSPNSFHSAFEFREGSQQHEELTGETFWVLDMEAGFPTSMWYVRPDRMEPIPDPELFLTGWIYTGPTGEQVPLRADEVILEKRPDPLDPYRGAGPVASILPNIQQQRYATEYQRNLFLNGADPGGVITVPNRLDDAAFDELIDRWRQSHRGIARAGHVGVLEGGAQWEANAHTNKDMEYGQLRLANRDELREAWRIHKSMMGTADDVNRANAQTAQEVFTAWQILPRLNRRRDTLNTKLLPLFNRADRTLEFDYEDPSPINAETAAQELLGKAQAAQALVAAGYDQGDVLETVGLPDMAVAEKPTQAPALPPGWVPGTPPGAPPAASPAPGPQEGDAQPGQPGNRVRPVTTIRFAAPAQPDQDLAQVDQQWKTAVTALTAAYLAHIIPAQRQELLGQIRRLLDTGNTAGLAALTVNSAAGAALILDAMTSMAQTAAKTAAAQAARQGATGVNPRQPDPATVNRIAATTAALQAAQLALSAGSEASRVAAPGATGQQVAEKVQAFLETLTDPSLTGRLPGALSAAQNTARIATFTAGPRCELAASELHDTNSCDPCDEIDGHVFGYSDDPGAVAAAQAAYPAGGYIACDGGDRCRGTVMADYAPAATTVPAAAWSSPLVDARPLPTLPERDFKPVAQFLLHSLNGHSRGASV